MIFFVRANFNFANGRTVKTNSSINLVGFCFRIEVLFVNSIKPWKKTSNKMKS